MIVKLYCFKKELYHGAKALRLKGKGAARIADPPRADEAAFINKAS